MSYAQLPDFRMFYLDEGDGTPIVFLHGFSIDHRSWQQQLDYFKDRHRVLIPDARGHGRSGVTPTGYSRAHRVEDLLHFADILKLERFHLVGLSMGGSTALGCALTNPKRLLSLTLVATGAAGYRPGKKFDRLDEIGRRQSPAAANKKWLEWATAWFADDRRSHLREFVRTMISQYSGAVWADPMRGKYSKEDDLSRAHNIDVPTLIVSGTLDRVFLPLGRMLHERIGGSVLTEYEDIGHLVNLEAPDRFNADLSEFLEGVPVP